MKLFDNAEECKEVLLSFLPQLSEDNQRRLLLAVDATESVQNERDKIFRMLFTFRQCLWDIPEAIAMGFHKWMETELNERIYALQYHKNTGENKCAESSAS